MPVGRIAIGKNEAAVGIRAQVLTMGARTIGPEPAWSIVDTWLDSEFEGGRSAPKVATLRALDQVGTAPW
jgi:ribose 5-phosphate isomerase RpiB